MITLTPPIKRVENQIPLSKSIKEFIAEGFAFGAVFKHSDGSQYIAATSSPVDIVSLAAIKVLTTHDNGIFVGDIDNKVYICLITNKEVKTQIIIKDKDDIDAINRVTSFLYANKNVQIQYHVATNLPLINQTADAVTLNSDIIGEFSLEIPIANISSEIDLQVEKTREIKNYIETKNNLLMYGFGVMVLALITLSSAFYFKAPDPIEKKVAVSKPLVKKQKDDFLQMASVLTKTASNSVFVLKEVAKRLNGLNGLAGWDAFEVTVERRKKDIIMKISLKSVYGTIEELTYFSKQHNYQIDISNQNGYLISKIDHVPVIKKAARFHVGSYQRLITNSINAWWDNSDISFGQNKQSDKKWASLPVKINMFDIDASDMNSVSSLLVAMPLPFQSLICKRDLNQSLRWNINLSMDLIGVI